MVMLSEQKHNGIVFQARSQFGSLFFICLHFIKILTFAILFSTMI